MKDHIWRPLYVVLAVVLVIVLIRACYVPKGFGVWDRGYMYGWHRKGNEGEWKVGKVKYKTAAYCQDCHGREHGAIKRSAHAAVMCENCHGPALDHPDDPPKLTIDRDRSLCARCHALLPYKAGGRAAVRGISMETHHPEAECVRCHRPHDPRPEEGKP